MMHEQIHADLEILSHQLTTLKQDMDKAISSGRSFIEVKIIHMQIKELSRTIDLLKNSQAVKRDSN